ncbi:acyltransferase family protein [Sphingomonas spermidinifaciens]|uniref:acyltransferase family protein n=1 Tax=Sphingomonas spermidinifaciens TaxID=1141889 RepID=UPI0015967621|nr:acyltransferase [Sphingomonas spermidinifaciens]
MARQRLDHIDGLRGIAAQMVVFGHWAEYVGHVVPNPALHAGLTALFREGFNTGRLGVVAFFCISGFVIPFSFSGTHPLRSFIVSRIFRLYPAYWVSIAAAALLFPLIAGIHFDALQVAANLTMVQPLLRQPDMLGVYWTLFIELIFYGICFLAFAGRLLHSARFNLAMMAGFLGLALLIGLYRWLHPTSGLPVGLPTYLAAMHFGTLARLALIERDRLAARLFWPAAAMLAICVTVANTLAYLYARNELVGWMAANTGYLAGLALFLGCAARGWFRGRFLAWLGLLSYSVYLFHPIFMQLNVALWPTMDWRAGIALLTPLIFVGSLVVAWAVQRFVEAPAVRAGRAINRRFDALHVRRRPAEASEPLPEASPMHGG